MAHFTAKPRIENENGTFEIVPGDNVKALSWGSWRFRWIPGYDVQPGGGMDIILIPRFPTNRWSLPQTEDPTAPGYVTASSQGETIVAVGVLRWPLLQKPHGATLHIIQIGVGGRTVEKGEAIEVVYGDMRGGSLGTRAQLVAREVFFPVFVANGQSQRFLERFVSWNRNTDITTLRQKADFAPSLRVVGAKAHAFHVTAPMEAAPGEPFGVKISVLDEGCNAASGYRGTVEVKTTDEGAPQAETTAVDGSNAVVSGVVFETQGFHRIYIIDPDKGIIGVSNPIRVTRDPGKVYWGEIHGHSESSDGNGTLDEHYTYARDAALLDFACVSDHDKHLYEHPDRWKFASDTVNRYNRDGRFVAILGYEGRTRDPEQVQGFGDINVYYRKDQEEMLEPFTAPLTPDVTRGKEVLLIPHTPLYGPPCNMGTYWEYLEELGVDIMPLVEVFSTHGNSEYYDCPRHVLWQAKDRSVLAALKKGFRLGFIGSSDYHEVMTGSVLRIQDQPRAVNHRHMQARCGLAAVRSQTLSRDGIFSGLKQRRTYATSGIRAYIDFSVNGCEMGSECSIASPMETRMLNVAVAAPERIEKLEVLRNGDVIYEISDGNWFREAELVDNDPIPEGAFYYIRVTTERMDFAWSSPVWVDIGKQK